MSGSELADKLEGGQLGAASPEHHAVAKVAFLLNLIETMGCREEYEETPEATLTHCLCQVRALSSVKDIDVQEAHCAMIFPWNRAIISRCLYGEGLVTASGVPRFYDV